MVEVDPYGLFAFLWETEWHLNRLRIGMKDASSWLTLLRHAKMHPQDFNETEENI